MLLLLCYILFIIFITFIILAAVKSTFASDAKEQIRCTSAKLGYCLNFKYPFQIWNSLGVQLVPVSDTCFQNGASLQVFV